MARLYLSPPDLDGDERDRVMAAIDSNWVAPLGPDVDAFEAELAEATGVSHAAALSSGTAGLHLALLLHGIGPGDRVIVPTMTFAATANAVVYTGAEPVFVDTDPFTANISPDALETMLDGWSAEMGRPPVALISVDLYGQCCDYDRLVPICAERGLLLIEDAAEALGATWQSQRAGSFGSCGVVSFNGNKIITTSGGGMLMCNDPDVVQRARFLATQAREPAPYYEHEVIGFNYRMSNLLAALGRGQLARLDHKVARRRAIRQRYVDAFSNQECIEMLGWDERGEPNGWLSVALFNPDSPVSPDEVRETLESHDIEARPMWKPMHMQPVFASSMFSGGTGAESLFARGLCLPSGSAMSEADQDRTIDIVLSCVR